MADTLLLYALTTYPFPLQASPPSGNANVAALTLVATNATSNGVTLQGVIVTLPIGDGAPQLLATKDVPNIELGWPPGWKLADKQTLPGAVQYDFQPVSGGTVGSNQSLTFTFSNIVVNTQPGTVAVAVMEGSNDCQPPACPTATLYLTKFPAGWGAVSFWADPPIISAGSATTLKWAGPAGAVYTVEYYTPQTGLVNVPAAGQSPLSNEGQYPAQGQPPLQLEQNTTFYLTVVDTIGTQTYSAQQSVPVTVELPAPQITSFTVVPAQSYNYSVTYEGQTTTQPVPVELQWTTEHAQNCSLSGESELLLANGSQSQGLTQTTQFTLTAQGQNEPSASQTITASVETVLTVELSFTPISGTGGMLFFSGNIIVPSGTSLTAKLLSGGTVVLSIEATRNESSEPISTGYSNSAYVSEWSLSTFSVSLVVQD